jgi:hypothetical protein
MPGIENAEAAPDPGAASPSPLAKMLLDLKEITSTTVALSIVGVTLFAFWYAFTHTVSDVQKDLLGPAMSLLGTVTGYYFGRVPSEKRAESAESTSAQVHQAAERTRQQARMAIDDAVDTIQSSGSGDARGVGVPTGVIGQLRSIRSRI